MRCLSIFETDTHHRRVSVFLSFAMRQNGNICHLLERILAFDSDTISEGTQREAECVSKRVFLFKVFD